MTSYYAVSVGGRIFREYDGNFSERAKIATRRQSSVNRNRAFVRRMSATAFQGCTAFPWRTCSAARSRKWLHVKRSQRLQIYNYRAPATAINKSWHLNLPLNLTLPYSNPALTLRLTLPNPNPNAHPELSFLFQKRKPITRLLIAWTSTPFWFLTPTGLGARSPVGVPHVSQS